MGLDWLPGAKIRVGCETEYRALEAALSRSFCWRRKSKQTRLEALTVQTWETLGAPLVGSDHIATEWARKNFANRIDKSLTMDSWMKHLHGLPVVELVDSSDGIPRFSNGMQGEYVGPESFRAQFLSDCVHIIGEDVWDEAFAEMAPAECTLYGEKLHQLAVDFARTKGIELSQVDDREIEDVDSDEFHLSVVLAASRWCIFWGQHGHGMVPWF